MNITLIGMPGSGKSYVGKELADRLGYRLLEMDRVMEATYQKSLPEILEEIGESAFLEEQTNDVLWETSNCSNTVISPGGSIIYSPVAMEHLKMVSKVVYLQVSLATIEKRISNIPRAIIGLKEKSLHQLYEERTELYEHWSDTTVNGDQEAEMVINEILAKD